MTLQKHNFLYFTALPPTIDKFSIRAEPFHPSLVRPTATPRPRSDHLLHIPSAIHPSFQPLLNHDPTAPQPFPRHPATTLQPRHNHPSCRIQERFRHNHPTSTILESTTSSYMALARPSTGSAVASLPAPPATRRKSSSCWQWCHERRRVLKSQGIQSAQEAGILRKTSSATWSRKTRTRNNKINSRPFARRQCLHDTWPRDQANGTVQA